MSVVGMTRKGGIPTTNLRGVTESDFFQKNNTTEKGWTFNFDGTLVDFKRPKLAKDLEEKVGYELGEEAFIKQQVGKGGKQKGKSATVTAGFNSEKPMRETGMTDQGKKGRRTDDFVIDEKTELKTMIGQKQTVIDAVYSAPSKTITLSKGVELIEKGKVTRGEEFSKEGKFRLSDYRKLHDPRQQQVSDTMSKRRAESSSRLAGDTRYSEDPAKDFRKFLLQQAKRDTSRQTGFVNTGSASALERHNSSMSNIKISKDGDLSMEGLSVLQKDARLLKKSTNLLSIDKVSLTENTAELEYFMSEVSLSKPFRTSIDSSYPNIQINDLAAKPKLRSSTIKNDYRLNLRVPPSIHS